MQVITNEFKQAVLDELNKLEDGFYLTRSMVCERIGVGEQYENVVSILMQDPEFSGFESVKSRGIRKRK